MVVWGDKSMVYMHRSPRGSCSGAVDRGGVVEPRSLGHRPGALF
jgi:hypothetical protein